MKRVLIKLIYLTISFTALFGDACSAPSDCAAVTDVTCDTTCKCADGFVEDGSDCKKGIHHITLW